jgi:HK97 family phage portal protein
VNLIQKTIGYLSRAFSLTDADSYRALDAQPSSAGMSVTQDSVLTLSAAWACVNLIAGTVGSLPLEVRKPGLGGIAVPAPEHPLWYLLHDSPNRDQTALDFWEFVQASLELRGNAYARKIKFGDRLVALMPVRPDIVSTRVKDGKLQYVWTDNAIRYELFADDMLHIRGFGGSANGGLSTIAYGRQVFGLAQAVDTAAAATFRNGLKPSGVVKHKKWLTPDQRKQSDLMINEYAGAMKAGKPIVMEGDIDWVQLTISPQDAEMLLSRGFAVEEICRFFGVPPIMIGHGDKTSSWGTGVAEVTQGFVKYTLRRRLKRIEQALRKQLLSDADRAAGITLSFNLDALLRGDAAARAAFYEIMIRNGIMTINECRALEGLPPVPGGDEPRVQMQNQPISSQIGHNGGPPLSEAA